MAGHFFLPYNKNVCLYAGMAKRLEGTEAMSSRAMKKLSEKQKTIQEQAKLLREKEKEGSTDGSSAKDK